MYPVNQWENYVELVGQRQAELRQEAAVWRQLQEGDETVAVDAQKSRGWLWQWVLRALG
jgi:hypothetical protein